VQKLDAFSEKVRKGLYPQISRPQVGSPEVIDMKKIIISISVVIVALAVIFGLPAWEEEDSPVVADNMAEDQNPEVANGGGSFNSENLTAINSSVDEGLSEASGP